MSSFVHLHLHTEYSIADGLLRVPALMEAVARAGMPAVAVTDRGNLFAMVKFFRDAERAGIKPVIGVEARVHEPAEGAQPSELVLLCQNETGYRRLTSLVTRSFLEGQHRGVPIIAREWLGNGGADGLIALSGGRRGDIGRALLGGRDRDARDSLDRWLELFGDRFYLELQRTGRDAEETYLHGAVALAAERGVPVVATNDVCFLERADFEAHEARVCIHQGCGLADPGRVTAYSEQQYLRRPEEMQALFDDLPEALENSVEIARRCNLDLALGRSFMPQFPLPAGEDEGTYLRRKSRERLDAILSAQFDPGASDFTQRRAPYDERLEAETDVICRMGFAGYFLIVADFTAWARNNGIPVGPGRGSGAGSLVAWALGITGLDPIRHDLLFERFLNPERVSMPDFDIDFCVDGRDRVIDYVAATYGRERVSQIITYGRMAAKLVVRDVGRVLGHPYGFVDRIAKLIPFELKMTLDKALEQDSELQALYENEEGVRELIDLARSLEGLVRSAGTHAGGVVIAPTRLTDFAPLYCDANGHNVVTQFDKDDAELVGLVKFDFLGLRTLTIIDRALATINADRAARAEPPLTATDIPLEDPATYALLRRCATTAIFQLESRGMKDLIKRLKPDNFDDVVALVALFRPGPLQSGMVDEFIERKHAGAGAAIDYLHPALKPILEPTYGVILYQEQVMQIAQLLAGYSLGQADILRRAMGKKKGREMARQRSVFIRGAVDNGVAEVLASRIFDIMEKFALYGFNKSHSAAYAVLACQTAWLKAHHPAAFMAAVLSADMDQTAKVVELIHHCRHDLGLEVEAPDVNTSEYGFNVSSAKSIRYGLGAIKGVGRAVLDALVAEREGQGAYRDIVDFCRRMGTHRVNRRVLEALIRSGAMDCLGRNRASLMAALPDAMRLSEQSALAVASGQDDLFGLAAPATEGEAALPELPEWSERVRLAGERETLGRYHSGHPIHAYAGDLDHLTDGRIDSLIGARAQAGTGNGSRAARPVTVAGLVHEVRRRGNRITLTLDDDTARIEVTVFDELYQRRRNVIARDAILVVEGSLRFDEFIDGWRVTAQEICDIDEARERHARRLVIDWPSAGSGPQFIRELKETLQPFREGPCGIWVNYRGREARARVSLGREWRVRPARELIDRLSGLVGGGGVRVVYPRR
ncbi:MAG: DNA polymerase III subunit alpha [Gammaproteobacteria bacterium]